VSSEPLLKVGYIARAHGMNGEVAIRTFDPSSEALYEVERVVVTPRSGNERELTLREVREGPRGDLLVSFEKTTGRTMAEHLVGATVFVRREDLPPPEEGEFFQGDLVGLKAFDEAGVELGEVAEVWSTGPVPNLVIRGPAVGELIVPFVDEFVPKVELEAGRVIIRKPEYLE
jgi:16S rRNA processing protein RimM